VQIYLKVSAEPKIQDNYMNLRVRAIKGVFWSGVDTWGRQLISLIIVMILARILTPDIFGLVALATVFTAFIQLFLDQGFSDAIIQLEELEPEHLDTAFWTNIGVAFLFFFISLITADWVSVLFRESQLAPIIRWLSLSFLLFSLSSTQQALLRRELAFRELSIRSLVSILIGGATGIIVAVSGYGVWSLVAQNLVGALVGTLLLWRVSGWRPKLRFSKKHFSPLFTFGINVTGTKIFYFANRNTDKFLIGYFWGTTVLGFYVIAYNILLVMTTLLIRVIASVAMPVFSRIQGATVKLQDTYYQTTNITSLIAYPAFTGVILVASELIPVLYGEKWITSVPVLQILAFVGFVHPMLLINSSVFLALSKPQWELKLNFLSALLNVTLFLLVVQQGIVAVATAYVVTAYVLFLLSYYLIYKLIQMDFRIYLQQITAPIWGSIAITCVVLLVKYLLGETVNPLTKLVISVLFGGTTYLLFLWLIFPSLFPKFRNLIYEAIKG
jgi:O-antigen/teichoic acid export membrane protein